ncbi:MAG: putative DNA-binding domain-containing protein [Oligoflexales bacterium]|nr:putative DNA-binding domain-containing protein [Oligoflexales bacterium]
MNLRELQDQYYRHIVCGEPLGDASDLIIPGGLLNSVSEAMTIHSKGYFARLTEALGELYQAVWFVLGDELFFSTCKKYIQRHPSHTYNLSLYGHNFLDSLVEEELAHEYPFLKSIAEFELAFAHIFHEKQDNSVLASELYFQISQNLNCKIKFCQTVKFLSFDYPVYKIWQACKEENVDQRLDWNEKSYLCLFKNEEKVFIRSFEENEFLILLALHEGMSLQDILEDSRFQQVDPNTVQSFFKWLASSGVVETLYEKDQKDPSPNRLDF